ncbi:hypothetical protein LTR95_016792 [Oleoguttula sp. CCFEE 5521]
MLARCYNAIAHIDRQQKSIPPYALQHLAELFVRHGVQDNFGVFLLHRHRALTPNSAIVHTRTDIDTDVGIEEELGLRDISPCMFLSHARGRFHPVEFEVPSHIGVEDFPGDTFLLDLADFLWDRQLQEILGFCRVSPADDPWIETLLSDEGDTIATRCRRSISALDGTITQWGFLLDEGGGIWMKSLRACKESESGGHVRT